MRINIQNRVFKFAAYSLLLTCCLVSIASAQLLFDTPQEAAKTFIHALKNQDRNAYNEIFGSDWQDFIPTDEVDREDVNKFLQAWDQSHSIQFDADDLAYITVGKNNWLFPIPVTKTEGGWRFNPQLGEVEIITRRIGRNEISAIQSVLAYYDAQREYALKDHNGDGNVEYAQKIISTPGEKDGLYWAALEGEPESPLGPLYGEDTPGEGYHGYYFKILKRQGPDAEGGAYNYLLGNRMIGGFALVAWPVDYGESGIMTFIINHEGQVYESDLGPETDTEARKMDRFNPDTSWEKTTL